MYDIENGMVLDEFWTDWAALEEEARREREDEEADFQRWLREF